MDTDRKWVVVRIDGKIAAISSDYRGLGDIVSRLTIRNGRARKRDDSDPVDTKVERHNRVNNVPYNEIKATVVGFDEVWKLRQEARWEDLLLFGTDFQKKVWRKLWELTHRQEAPATAHATGLEQERKSHQGCQEQMGGKPDQEDDRPDARLISYSDFAELCQNRAGVRAVAHAIGLNPVAVVIPCHLVIPKETIDKICEIQKKAETTIFKGEDLCLNSILRDKYINFGEYSLGKKLKRELIAKELG